MITINCNDDLSRNTLFLFDEIIDDRLLVAIKLAGQGNYEEMEGLYDMGHCQNRLSVILFVNNIILFLRIFAPYAVTDDPFATWSSNKMEPNWTGFWMVEVLDRNGKVIGFETFEYNHPRNLQMNPNANKFEGSDNLEPEGRGHRWGW